MLDRIKDWFGIGGGAFAHADGHDHGAAGGHGHTHGVIDPGLASTERGIWAIKWSFVILAITAAVQIVVVVISGSVALLADTIHNVGDATTAIPLWIAFALARRKPSKTFPYGLGRVEDLAGVFIVLVILASAIVAGYEAISRFFNPQPVTQLGWLAAAGVLGFIGNEVVAVFRIRVGRQMNSAALIADGYHARTDGLTSLAVVFGALGVWLGFPLADPIIGLIITIAIFGIVWQSAHAVVTRMLDGVEADMIGEIEHAAAHVPGVRRVTDAKARWLGHKLHADITIDVDVDDAKTLSVGNAVATRLEAELRGHIPTLATLTVQFERAPVEASVGGHHHAPDPFRFTSSLAEGELVIVHTPDGERMRLSITRAEPDLKAVVRILRADGPEVLELFPDGDDAMISRKAPAEPHEFDAVIELATDVRTDVLQFRMTEPEGHAH